MKSRILTIFAATALLFTLHACGAAKQNIPVSSSPSGAIVYADGTEVGTTPCNVPLVKTQAHILTLQKEGYKQADVQISQVYDTAAVVRGAVQSGTGASSMGSNTEGAISNALLNTEAMESQGTAYVLSPSSVIVTLVPKGQNNVAQTDAPIVINKDQLSLKDQKALSDGTANTDGPVTISSDQLAPQDQEALVRTTKPATMGQAVEDNPEQAAEAALEAAAAAAPTIGTKKKWKSSHSSESTGNDGSFSKTTTSTSTSVGVSINPAEAGLGLLRLLKGTKSNENQPEQTQE